MKLLPILFANFSFACCLTLLATSTQAQSGGKPAQPRPAPIAVIANNDLAAWRSTEAIDTRQAYEGYLSRFQNGWFAPVARARAAPGLPDNQPVAPIMAPSVTLTPKTIYQLKAYDNATWALAQSIGTQNAMADYLRRLPSGDHRMNAARRYIDLTPLLPSGVAPDCTQSDMGFRALVRFDIERAYPQAAIDKGLEGSASGDILIDRDGVPLAFVNSVFSSPEVFQDSTERGVLKSRYRPPKTGCNAGPYLVQIMIRFSLG